MLFGDVVIYVVGFALLGAGIYLISLRGFWVVALGVGGLAACFATLASIIHFQIIGALGFFAVMAACWFGAIMLMMPMDARR